MFDRRPNEHLLIDLINEAGIPVNQRLVRFPVNGTDHRKRVADSNACEDYSLVLFLIFIRVDLSRDAMN